MIAYKNIEQRSPQWHALRRGVLTASEFNEVVTPTGKLADSEKSRRFIRGLVLDCIDVGDPHKEADEKKLEYNFAINWGNEHEGAARRWFAENVMPVSEVGFVKWGEHIPIGCSPDGVIPSGDEIGKWHAGLEIKCPSLSAHVSYLDAGTLPDEYKLQVHGSMAVTGLDRWYFLSYYPRPKFRNFLIEVKRDGFTERVEQSLTEFVEVYRSEFRRISDLILVATEGSEVAA